MQPIKHNFPDVEKEYYSLIHELRVSKHGDKLDVYRVSYTDSDGKSTYVVFKSQDSAIDFILSNL